MGKEHEGLGTRQARGEVRVPSMKRGGGLQVKGSAMRLQNARFSPSRPGSVRGSCTTGLTRIRQDALVALSLTALLATTYPHVFQQTAKPPS